MKGEIFKCADDLKQVHALLASELSKEWPVIPGTAPMDAVTLALLSKILNTLDYLLSASAPDLSGRLYQLSCKGFFGILSEMQREAPMIEAIEAAFGKNCYFLRLVLEQDEERSE